MNPEIQESQGIEIPQERKIEKKGFTDEEMKIVSEILNLCVQALQCCSHELASVKADLKKLRR